MDKLLDELVRLYAHADALYGGTTCEASSECCRFGITGREPYVTSVELALLRRGLARRGGALAPRRRALPVMLGARTERICPLLDSAGRCSVYAERPLGCRTFYCERAAGGIGPARGELRALVRALVDLAARHAPRGEHARPLTHVITS